MDSLKTELELDLSGEPPDKNIVWTARLPSLYQNNSPEAFVDPLFETDYDENSELDTSPPSSGPRTRSAYHTGLYGIIQPGGQNNNTVIAKARLCNETRKQNQRSKYTRTTPLSRSQKRFALLRIKDEIAACEVQLSKRSGHIIMINGLPPRTAVYGMPERSSPGSGSILDMLRGDKDIILADSSGKSGYCQGCGNLFSIYSTERWLRHKIGCYSLQSKLHDELNNKAHRMQRHGGRDAQRNTITESEASNEDSGRTTANVTDKVIRPKTLRSNLFKQNELISVRVGDKIQYFRYQFTKAQIKLSGLSLAKVFYGIELTSGLRDRSSLFKRDPDIASFSMEQRTCVCRGCRQTVSIEQTCFWLFHRLECPVLQLRLHYTAHFHSEILKLAGHIRKHRADPGILALTLENEDRAPQISVTSELTKETSASSEARINFPKKRPLRKRTHEEVLSSDEDHVRTRTYESDPPTKERKLNETLGKSDDTLHPLSETEHAEDLIDVLESWLHSGFDVLRKVVKAFEWFE